ncbi:hypothetical protein DEA06_14055 [Microbacterium sp. Gd 4-13]|uniref:DUF7882 family protein n=1 Tax=Microbacterium sp. Gd 4-13 TaxID=2173179 RepID=UPI000D5698C4|nr:hypothetical protein [Microbacterium sp. Gd 4-13]PVW03313.1 hypothetical protein DEA06_14055 [Microbacterium sp. Gd 4-13]
MAKLYYGNSADPIEMPDRLLAHVKVVLATKLRRSESFTLSWQHPDDSVGARSTVWIQPSIPLRFVFSSAEPEALDPSFLTELATAANSSGGLTIDTSIEVPAAQIAADRPRAVVRAA